MASSFLVAAAGGNVLVLGLGFVAEAYILGCSLFDHYCGYMKISL